MLALVLNQVQLSSSVLDHNPNFLKGLQFFTSEQNAGPIRVVEQLTRTLRTNHALKTNRIGVCDHKNRKKKTSKNLSGSCGGVSCAEIARNEKSLHRLCSCENVLSAKRSATQSIKSKKRFILQSKISRQLKRLVHMFFPIYSRN